MGFLDTFRHRPVQNVAYRVVEGTKALEVVGEGHYQADLWRLAGGNRQGRIRLPVVAVLRPDPQNQYDPNAVAVHIDGALVGHVPRPIAQVLSAPLLSMYQQVQRGEYIAVRGEVVGGTDGNDGRKGRLGVFLTWDPAAFGITKLPSGANPGSANWAAKRPGGSGRPGAASLAKTGQRCQAAADEKVTLAQAETLERAINALDSDLNALREDLKTIGEEAAGKVLRERLWSFGFEVHSGPVTAAYLDELSDEVSTFLGALEDIVGDWSAADREDRLALKDGVMVSADLLLDRIKMRPPE
ncbi:hypothetical protein D0Z08_04905 [Nocardioides immobilis]|uniref:HIRAN domain-containing protein n=1 Tax=Nocardioides immobilis TaxID=2049295 RepID=A0A417Y6I8_9ACTN|nr:HIRAN domain-containing protein [Nocardioides immobilis]RHW28318.1 hypothetical protein D0Z08_04905 [Nocardioides immobilis]